MDGPMPASPSLKKNVPVEKLTSFGLGKATGDPLSEWADVKAALSLVPDKRSFQAERTLALPWDGRTVEVDGWQNPWSLASQRTRGCSPIFKSSGRFAYHVSKATTFREKIP